MREIYGLENHEDLEELLTKAEMRINEESLDEALTHMRKAVEYIVQQFVRENPDCTGKDLSEMMRNLESAGIIKKADADLLHQIRKKGNTVGAHVTGEKITKQRAGELFHALLEYLPKFLEEIPYPSQKTLVGKNRLSIDCDSIPPLKVEITKDIYEDIIYGSVDEEDYDNHNIDYFKKGFIPDEFFFEKRNGELYVNRAEYAKWIEKRIRKILTAQNQLSEYEGNVCVPGILQEYFGFSRVYQDGITPVFEEISGDDIIYEFSLFSEQICLPNSVTQINNPYTTWYAKKRNCENWEKHEEYKVASHVKQIFLSNNLSADSDFSWTKMVPASNVRLTPGKKGTITVQNGSVYSSDMKKLVFARCDAGDEFIIPEGVQIIGKHAFTNRISNIVFPKSLRKIEDCGLVNYKKDKIIIPDYVTEIAPKAFDRSAIACYESAPDININAQYEDFIKEIEEERKQEELRRQEYIKNQAELQKKQLEENARKQKQLAEQRAREAKALQEAKKKKRNRNIGKILIAVIAIAVLIFVGKQILAENKETDKESSAANIQESATEPPIDEVVHGTTEDGLYEYTKSNDTITLTKYLGTEEEVMIPNEIDGAAVTVLGNGLFVNNKSVVSVVIPDTVVEIQAGRTGSSAFGHMDKLERVTIPGSVKVIGSCTFISCDILSEVILEEGIEEIGYSAFEGCYGLKEITIPESVIKLGTGCFFKTGITSITINPQCEVEGALFFGGTVGEINYYE